MIYTRQQLEELEDQQLAPYGIRSKDSKGRKFPEEEADFRTRFQRDRERVLHTTAFRRLEYKTQVFINQNVQYLFDALCMIGDISLCLEFVLSVHPV